MINIIIQTIIENKEFIEKSLEESIKCGEISLFSKKLRTVFDEAGRKTLVGILETIDLTLFESQRRKQEYETKDLRKRTIITDYGNIEYYRRYYRNKQNKEYIYLTDEKMGIEKNERIMKDVQSKIIEFAHDISYLKTGKKVVGSEEISPTTVMKKVRQEELKVETQEEKKEIKRLYICGDGASWIKEGLNWIEKSEFVLDKFHLLKYINQATVDYPEYRSKLWYNINIFDPVSVERIFKEILEKTIEEKRKEKVLYSYKYVMNQWKGIEIYETEGKYLKGCSAEGHISHVYADRMSSRPRTWSDDGIDKMSRLRTFVSNGGNIYENLIKRKKVNAKLKKYDRIIERNIKIGIEESKNYQVPTVNTGMHSDIRKILKKIMYG